MMELQNDRLIKALLRQPVDRTPAWLMRQAGRYLPEYRALRQQVPNFIQFCKTPELVCEATMQPLRRYPLDAAIMFSDILVVPAAMGCNVHFLHGEGPKIEVPIRSQKDVDQLHQPDIDEELGYVLQGIRLMIQEMQGKLPLIGFAGSPWTVATYMVEGGSSKLFKIIKQMLYREPQLLQNLLQKITDTTIKYLNAQVESGVHALMVFDTWGGVLSQADYQQFSLAYMQQIAQHVTRERDGQRIPLIFFTKNGGQWLELMADAGCDALGLDWTANIGQARQRVGDRVALQGNLDPMLLYATPDKIRSSVTEILDAFGPGSGHVFNLGHGIDKDTPPESVSVMLDTIHEYFAAKVTQHT